MKYRIYIEEGDELKYLYSFPRGRPNFRAKNRKYNNVQCKKYNSVEEARVIFEGLKSVYGLLNIGIEEFPTWRDSVGGRIPQSCRRII